MIDEIFDRNYREARQQLNAAALRLVASLAESFRALHRIQFAAPWSRPEPRPRKPEWRRVA
ncbi:hypothetical protein HMF7854_06030 [Sphingomonas ginkgonis]|uniref:Uncharacterized protein n=1 Tax=Sphingomonas ginkgonis TaxID=2315330 RepID=A0A3R9WN97_9SPHN|nr:hypothetical protein [Sphingomonas ginkgonis]RST30433.1 hypothetical protein HMF7854_06030 [Sphingomonas ginkgonis]